LNLFYVQLIQNTYIQIKNINKNILNYFEHKKDSNISLIVFGLTGSGKSSMLCLFDILTKYDEFGKFLNDYFSKKYSPIIEIKKYENNLKSDTNKYTPYYFTIEDKVIEICDCPGFVDSEDSEITKRENIYTKNCIENYYNIIDIAVQQNNFKGILIFRSDLKEKSHLIDNINKYYEEMISMLPKNINVYTIITKSSESSFINNTLKTDNNLFNIEAIEKKNESLWKKREKERLINHYNDIKVDIFEFFDKIKDDSNVVDKGILKIIQKVKDDIDEIKTLIDDIIKTIVEFNKEYTKQNLENKLVEAQQIKWTKIKTNELNTLCNQCHNNCHIDCKLEIIENNNKDKFKSCKAFYSRWFISPWKSYCDTNCKCHYNYHNHEFYKWIRGVDEDNILKLKKRTSIDTRTKIIDNF